MLWMTNYALNVIRPKIYCFENAPTIMGSRGIDLRAQFEGMAKKQDTLFFIIRQILYNTKIVKNVNAHL